MVTITLPQLENLLRHDTNALQQVRALHESGLAKTYGVASGDILRLVQKTEKESTDADCDHNNIAGNLLPDASSSI